MDEIIDIMSRKKAIFFDVFEDIYNAIALLFAQLFVAGRRC